MAAATGSLTTGRRPACASMAISPPGRWAARHSNCAQPAAQRRADERPCRHRADGRGGAKLVLGAVRFAGRRDGWTDVSTVALLDGPFSGGRVTGLRVPISGRFGPGARCVSASCLDARFATVTAGALRLGPTRLPLCPRRRDRSARAGGEGCRRSDTTSGCAAVSANRHSRSMRPGALRRRALLRGRHRARMGRPIAVLIDAADARWKPCRRRRQWHVRRRRCGHRQGSAQAQRTRGNGGSEAAM